jgi:hypothetical protein
MAREYTSRWSLSQAAWITGADQVFVFGKDFIIIAVLLLVAWLMLVMRMGDIELRSIFLGLPGQLTALSAIGLALVPGAIMLPGWNAALVYIPERMSLGVAILFCAVLASATPTWVERASIVVLAAAFFGLLYQKTSRLNRLEDEVQVLVNQMPPMQRVIVPLIDKNSRVPWLAHLADRACIGHCYSYANYEPSTDLFRVRVLRRNPFVAATYAESYQMQIGEYRPTAADPPIYRISSCGEQLCASLLAPEATTR